MSVTDIGNKRSIALYLQKLDPNQIINTNINFLISYPAHEISVPVTLKDNSKANIKVEIKIDFVLDYLISSNDSNPQIGRCQVSVIDTNTISFADMFINFSNNKLVKLWQIQKISFFRNKYDNFLLFNIDRNKLKPHKSVPNLFTVEGDFNALNKLIGYEKNGKFIAYLKI